MAFLSSGHVEQCVSADPLDVMSSLFYLPEKAAKQGKRTSALGVGGTALCLLDNCASQWDEPWGHKRATQSCAVCMLALEIEEEALISSRLFLPPGHFITVKLAVLKCNWGLFILGIFIHLP
jgi:hypothetical protein